MSDRNPGWRMRRARDLAATAQLEGIDFLHKNGRVGAKGNSVHRVRLNFYDHEPLVLTVREFSMLHDVEFKLRESEQRSD